MLQLEAFDLTGLDVPISLVLDKVWLLHFKHFLFNFDIIGFLFCAFFGSEDEAFAKTGVDGLSRKDHFTVWKQITDFLLFDVFSHVEKYICMFFGNLALFYLNPPLIVIFVPLSAERIFDNTDIVTVGERSIVIDDAK